MARLRFWKRGEDEEERHRMGRFSQADQREMEELVRVRSKRRSVVHQPSWRKKVIDRGYGMRAGRVLSYATVGQPVEAVLKVASTTKSDAGVARMVRYIGRIKASDNKTGPDITFRDELHNCIPSNSVMGHLEHWNLLPEGQNLSKKARSHEDPEALSEAERLRNVQGWHFVFSLAESSEDDEMASKLESVMAATVDEVFSEPGFKVLWALHKDHADHLHAHVIVKAVSRLGGRIWCDRAGDYLFGIRTIFAQNLQRAGLEYTATRREDRGQVREAIIAGYEPLRTNRHYKTCFLYNDEGERRWSVWQDTFIQGELPPKPVREGGQ